MQAGSHFGPGRASDEQTRVLSATEAGDGLLERPVRQRSFDHGQPETAWPVTTPTGDFNLVIPVPTIDRNTRRYARPAYASAAGRGRVQEEISMLSNRIADQSCSGEIAAGRVAAQPVSGFLPRAGHRDR
jgi:hypothetical protein